MAPTRKSGSVNKQFSDYTKVSPDKDDGNSNKSRQRKRKLSDMLGSQWSKEELECFYEAYRKYGKDWKKVASTVRSRSVETVEALYNMNKAYLSLPEGIASVVGLIAMMTDHYNVLEGSDSDRESNDASRLSRKTQKHGQGKVQFNALSRNDGCLSLLKRTHSDGCAVRKRTPRFPVTYSFRKDDIDNYLSPRKSGQKLELDDDVEHVAALALTEVSQRGGSPQVSQSPFRTQHIRSSPFQHRERMLSKSEMGRAKLRGPAIEEGGLGDIGVDKVEVQQRGKKVYRKKEKVEDIRINQFDDGWEACTGIEGLNIRDVKGEVDVEVTNPKIIQSSFQGKRKRKKRLLFGDDSSAFDALQTLADLSLMMPASAVESGCFVQLEEKPTSVLADRSRVHEAMSNRSDKTKLLGATEIVLHGFSGLEASTSGKSKLGMDLTVSVNATSEGQQQPLSANKPWKKKHKPSLKALGEEEENFATKGKHTSQKFSPLTHGEAIRPAECPSSSSDKKRVGNDSAVSTAEVLAKSHNNLPTKQRSMRKMDPRTQIQKERESPGNNSKNRHHKCSTVQDGVLYLKDKLSCCLSSPLVRRWCKFEWFYSAIDYPWFAKREFVEYLNHVGLGHIPGLTRVEWDVIRSSLGKPRRFSEHFLHEEKEKLKQYRESVRKHYTELRDGIRDGLPTDLARPLSVGQRVIALHPKSRECHDGSVLTVDHDKCRIQFDRPELGVEFVMDIDCMPLNPFVNMPEALKRQNTGGDKISLNSREPKAGQSKIGGPVIFAPNEHLEIGDRSIAISQAKTAAIDIVNPPQAAYSHPCTVTHINAREDDIQALTELTCTLDKKVSSAPLNLRQHNMYPGNSLSLWMKPSATSSGLNGPPSSTDPLSSTEHPLINYQESGSNVAEVVKDSRFKAHTMVDAAIQAMSLIREGEDAFKRIGEALASFDKQIFTQDCVSSVTKSSENVNGGVVHQHQLSSSASETLQRGYASGTNLHNDSDGIEAQIPSELITSCVATLLMVQMCTERQYPPADAAQILDSAVTSLHPCCPQNRPIYREIQTCMGRIKTQILALVPT